MRGLKYIVVDDGNLELPIVFSDILTHRQVAAGYEKIVGAGFVQTDGDVWSCYGESISLEIKSRYDTDSKLVTKHFGANK